MIHIGTTDVSPEVLAPTIYNIKVCACQDTPVGDGATQAFQCQETGDTLWFCWSRKKYSHYVKWKFLKVRCIAGGRLSPLYM